MLRPAPAPAAAAVSSSSYYVSPPQIPRRRPGSVALVRCLPVDGGRGASDVPKAKLKVGSPIVIVEAPLMLKTAASMPSLRYNAGQVKAGDVGRYFFTTLTSIPYDMTQLYCANSQIYTDIHASELLLRIMARKPKDVWAVRLAVGMYLLDGKHFKPLDVDDEDGDESPEKGK